MSSIVVTRAAVNIGSSAVITRASVAVTKPTGASMVVTRATVAVVQPIGSSIKVTRALLAVAPNLVPNPGGARSGLKSGTLRPLAAQGVTQGVITFEWTQVSGAPVTIQNGDKANASYTVPAL